MGIRRKVWAGVLVGIGVLLVADSLYFGCRLIGLSFAFGYADWNKVRLYCAVLFATLVLGLWLIRTGWRRRAPRVESADNVSSRLSP